MENLPTRHPGIFGHGEPFGIGGSVTPLLTPRPARRFLFRSVSCRFDPRGSGVRKTTRPPPASVASRGGEFTTGRAVMSVRDRPTARRRHVVCHQKTYPCFLDVLIGGKSVPSFSRAVAQHRFQPLWRPCRGGYGLLRSAAPNDIQSIPDPRRPQPRSPYRQHAGHRPHGPHRRGKTTCERRCYLTSKVLPMRWARRGIG